MVTDDFLTCLPSVKLTIREINGLSADCHRASDEAGWWDGVDKTNPYVIATKLCLIHSEVSEALEGARKDLMDDHLPHRKMVEVELADALIRIFDLAGAMKLDLGGALVEKFRYNMSRSDHKKEIREGQGGKKI